MPRLLSIAIAVTLLPLGTSTAGTSTAGTVSPSPSPSPSDTSVRQETAVPSHGGITRGRAGTTTVTLITGDRVVVRNGLVIETRPGPGRDGMAFHTARVGKRQHVIPLDALPLIAGKRLDKNLFDVGLLTEHGLDDASAPDLPLLVEYTGDARAARQSLASARVVREVPVVDAVAVRQDRRTTNDLWKRLASGQAAGIEKVWLDGGVRISLDRSVEQIGAPKAWRSGATGKGVKVAVLDTGYDPNHPDLADAVVAGKDFTEDGSVADGNGHGTHVASTIAGSGKASQGRRKGVAPDADLMVGKVCGARGGCEISAILAGMQWAADEGARVVNMSLGGFPTDGTDPMSQAVNELTARTGTLFVVAAGNYGGGGQRIGTPASADAALAVGSVTKSDALSEFSSTGPRWDDLGLKPEITAPGSRIVAARAAGTLGPYAVDESYAELSGTSMATPHVAGAAAIVAQQHPDWKADELRSALMGSAQPLEDRSVYEQGAGRVDVARAATQRVTAFPSRLDFGKAAYPHDDDQPITRTVAYRNDSDRKVTLRLRLDMKHGMFRLSRRTLDVPAHGTASVKLTADPRVPGPDGAYGGWLVASGAGTGVSVRTTVGINKEIPSYDLTITMLDREGNPAREDDLHVPYAEMIDVRNGVVHADVLQDGSMKVRVPRGTYTLNAIYGIANEETQGYQEVSSFQEPTLIVDRNTELVLDGRLGKRVEMRAPVPDASLATAGIGYIRQVMDFQAVFGTAVINPMRHGARLDLYLAPSRTTSKDFTAFGHAVWARMPADPEPDRDFFRDSPYVYHDVDLWPGRFPERPSLATSPGEYARMDAAYPAAGPDEVANRYAFPVLPDSSAGAFMFIPSVEMTLPFRRAEYYSVRDGMRWSFQLETFRYLGPEGGEIEQNAVVLGPPKVYRAGRTYTDRWNAAVFGPNLPVGVLGNPVHRGPWVFRDGDSITVSAPMFADSGPGRLGEAVIDTEHTTLRRNGELIGSSDTQFQQLFTTSAPEATYELSKEIARPDRYRTSTKVRSEWTFRSKRTADGQPEALPLLTVRFAPRLDDRNRAPAGRFRLPVEVERQAGKAPIRSLTVDISYDDGSSWHSVPVRNGTAVLDHPAEGFVSLRAKAVDTAGNQVDQTILRAYEIG